MDKKHTRPDDVVPLEPRVTKLEVGLDRLTSDVKDLAGIVRSQGVAVEGEIQKLVVAVTEASAPRKTDWPTLISLAFLILALGGAVFYPLNATVSEIKANQIRMVQQGQHDDDILFSTQQREEQIVQNRVDARLNKLERSDYDHNKAEIEEYHALKLKLLMDNFDGKYK
jgi:hypothetical protein